MQQNWWHKMIYTLYNKRGFYKCCGLKEATDSINTGDWFDKTVYMKFYDDNRRLPTKESPISEPIKAKEDLKMACNKPMKTRGRPKKK
jgi:hypothetical protein